MGKILLNIKTVAVICCVAVAFTFIPAVNLLGEEQMIPKDPVFSRQVASLTGIGAPVLFSIAGMIVNGSQPEHLNFAQATLLDNLISTIGLLTPPLGNFYAGDINRTVLITYGASNAAWLTGMVLYYRDGMSAREPPSTLEIIFIVAGFTGRLVAGAWDWYTVTETVYKRNHRLGTEKQTGFSSYFIEPSESRLGVRYSWLF